MNDEPNWHIVGAKLFQDTATAYQLAPCYNALKGYYASLKCCSAGLVYVADMSVTCFLASGDCLMLMANSAGYNTINDFIADARARRVTKRQWDNVEATLKGSKCRLKHLGHTKKIKGLGPAANEATFEADEGAKTTVAAYYEKTAKTKASYKGSISSLLFIFLTNYKDIVILAALDNTGKLLYPFLPLINVGTNTKPIYIPPVLVNIPAGQCRSSKMTPDMTGTILH